MIVKLLTEHHLEFPSLKGGSLSSGPVLRHLTEGSITTTEINL